MRYNVTLAGLRPSAEKENKKNVVIKKNINRRCFELSFMHRIHTMRTCGDVEMNPGSDLYNVCRDVCAGNLLNNHVTFGGQGHLCVIDESVVARRKLADVESLTVVWIWQQASCSYTVTPKYCQSSSANVATDNQMRETSGKHIGT